MTAAVIAPTAAHRAATPRVPLRHRVAQRWPVTTFLVLGAVLSWWPALGRLGNPDAALVIPIGPSIAGLLVVGWRDGRGARAALRRSAVTVRGVRGWRSLWWPFAAGAAAIATGLAGGAAVPSGDSVTSSLVLLALLPLTAALNGPLGEELGWRGFLLPHLLRTHSPVAATMRLIPMWVLFHLPLIVAETDRRLWWAISVAGLTVALTWIHLRSGGSVALAIVFHALVNSVGGAAIQLFDEADQPAAWIGWSAVWTVLAVALLAGPLRRASATGGRP
jgi:membrane protease YdiL (CAAX protease family)